MRIVTASEFLGIKEKVVFQSYNGLDQWGDLCIKTGNCGDNDFFFIPLQSQNIKTRTVDPHSSGELYDLMCELEKSSDHFVRDYDCEERDGLFDMSQLYVVYDENDIKQLINALQTIIGIGENND